MAKTENKDNVTAQIEELKGLIEDIKGNMMGNEDCNNQFYSVLQTLDGLGANLEKISQPSDEYTIIQTNILEVKKELAQLNQNIDETINSDLRELMSKLTEKVNRLEILTNNAGLDQQVVKNLTAHIEKNISNTMRDATDTLYSQALSSSEMIKKIFRK